MKRNTNTAKISVTIPNDLAIEIKEIIPQGEVSSFFTEALGYYLTYVRQKKALTKGAGIWKDENYPELKTTRDTVDYINLIRKTDRAPALHINEKKGHYAP
ncbi:MAG: hypothetical protein PHE50_00360 [Dehalococcoidales bacterium]|nr:hypothetical protein [Dehalococcoidales bacterium]